MKINSAAGEFEFDVTAMQLEGQDVVIIGTMGVWEARTVIEKDEVSRLLGLLVRSGAFWKLVPRLPAMLVRGLSARRPEPSKENDHV